LVAGYSWPWSSKENKAAMDIEIDGLQFQWNQTDKDWINSKNAFNEMGCIHTTQGYDLNYTGLIFGKEISFNKEKNCIEIDPKFYFDINGKKGISDPEDLKTYIINIYKTIMYRGIKGTFIYACNKDLREYLKKYISTYKKEMSFRILRFDEVKPFVNSVPLIDIYFAAGGFSDLQLHSNVEWIELPFNIAVNKNYFVCKVIGESMNKKIPNGSYCLFSRDEGGSRNGKIVLVESTTIQDAEFGSGYTIKEYQSEKSIESESWEHQLITLKLLSFNSEYRNIEIKEHELKNLKVVGVFLRVLE
jgi:SOS-response transcriptional repressor LexA